MIVEKIKDYVFSPIKFTFNFIVDCFNYLKFRERMRASRKHFLFYFESIFPAALVISGYEKAISDAGEVKNNLINAYRRELSEKKIINNYKTEVFRKLTEKLILYHYDFYNNLDLIDFIKDVKFKH